MKERKSFRQKHLGLISFILSLLFPFLFFIGFITWRISEDLYYFVSTVTNPLLILIIFSPILSAILGFWSYIGYKSKFGLAAAIIGGVEVIFLILLGWGLGGL